MDLNLPFGFNFWSVWNVRSSVSGRSLEAWRDRPRALLDFEVSPLHTTVNRVYINMTLAAATMVTPALLGRNISQTFRRQISVISVPRRGLAAATSGSFQYETGHAAGVKFASRDLPGPTTTLTVVAKAGTRYQTLPGYSDALEKFAFKVSPGPSCPKNWESQN